MTPDLIAATVALADTLQRENAALTALDMGRAVLLLDEKRAAAEAFTAALGQAAASPSGLGANRALAERLATRLQSQAEENRRLLERAMVVQGRVIGALARVVPRALAGAPRYGASGALAAPRRPPAVALSARA
jgi:hypothetical protein